MGLLDPPAYSRSAADVKFAQRRDVYRALMTGAAPATLHPSPPTVTHSTTATASTMRRVNRLAYGAQFSLLGCVPYDKSSAYLTNNSDSQQNNIAAWGWEVNTVGSEFEFRWRATPQAGVWMQIFVDDMPLTAEPVQPTGITLTIGGIYYTNLVFADARPRKVTVRWRFAALYDMYISQVGDLSATRPSKPRIACMGGSFSGSAGDYHELQAWPWALGDALGWEIFQCAIGGSGYAAGTPYGQTARLDALVATNPDFVLVEGSGNDDGQTYSAINTAAAALYSALATRLPGVPVGVIGAMPRSASSTIASTRAVNLQAVRDAAIAAPNVGGLFFDPCGTVDPMSPHAISTVYGVGNRVSHNGTVFQCFTPHTSSTAAPSPDMFKQLSWTSGTGTSTSPNGSGTRDIALGPDSVHPTVLGQKLFASHLIREMKTRLLALS